MTKRVRGRASLESRLGAVETPLFVLDARRTVVFFNAGLERLTGWRAEDVLGHACDYTVPSEGHRIAALTAALCPPAEVLAGKPAVVPTYLIHKDGRPLPRQINFFPLSDGEKGLKAVLGIVEPIQTPAATSRATAAQRLHAELAALHIQLRQRYAVENFVCRSPAMQRVLEQVQLARAASVPVLVVGEAGTGKEHVARLVHSNPRSGNRPFVPLDCRRLPPGELQAALEGILELSGGGHDAGSPTRPATLFLGNIDSLPRHLQERAAAAWRAGPPDRPVLPRLIAATSADLESAVAEETFSAELYYLLTPLVIAVPPLRARPQDIQPLAQHFLEMLNRRDERQVGGFSEEVWRQFAEYNWPGNVEELGAVVTEARAACAEPLIRLDHLPFRFRAGRDAQAVGPSRQPKPIDLEALVKDFESVHIREALQKCRGNKAKAARLLGMSRARLGRRMQALGIEESQ